MAAPTVPILIGGLVAWSIYRRVRRNIGRQRLRPWRSILSIVILSLISFFFCFFSLGVVKLMVSVASGICLGAMLGFVGLRLTQFDTTDEGHFYKPDTRIGIGLSLLFVGRLAYRFWAVRHTGEAPHSPPAYQSALTYFFFGLIAGYYIVYHCGLLSHAREKKKSALPA